jgi:hypothetical protein
MRLQALVLSLLILSAIPSVSSEGESDDTVFPPVQWTYDLNAGYISTAPLVSSGLVIVKSGGDLARGIPAGLHALRADNGDPVWFAPHNASTSGYETAPLLVTNESGTANTSSNCHSNRELVITGWTSGQLTAYDLQNGTEVWSVETEAPQWGITGGGSHHSNGIIWATETGMVMVCENDGRLQSQFESDYTSYRATTTLFEGGVALGTETGHLILANFSADMNLSNTSYSSLDLLQMANLSGSWKIRSTPTLDESKNAMMIHLQGDGESYALLLEIDSNRNITLVEQRTFPSGTGTGPSSASILGTSEGIHIWGLNSTNNQVEIYSLIAQNVIGEITIVNSNNLELVCVPQNVATGSWLLFDLESNSILYEWVPQVTQYVTAGCGGDDFVLAAANDASWVEIRYFDTDFSHIQGLSESISGNASTNSPSPDSPSPSSENGDEGGLPGIIWIPFCGTALVFLIAFAAQEEDLQRQISIVGLFLLVLSLIIVAPILTDYLQSDPVEDSSGRARASSIADWKENSPDSVSVAFHLPLDVSGTACYDGLIHYHDTSIDEYFISENMETCIVVISVDYEDGMAISDATIEAISIAEIEYQMESQALGLFIHSVGDADGGNNDRWWTYDLNGGYGLVGASDQPVKLGDEVDWHFDAKSP